MPKVTGVIVAYKRPDVLKRSLESMYDQILRPDRIIVVDNSPDNAVGDMVRKSFPSVEYRHFPENIGSEGGYHEGIKLAFDGTSSIWLLDDDCAADKDALGELIKWAGDLSKSKKVGAVRSAREWDAARSVPFLEIEDLIAWRGALILPDAVREIGFPEKELFLYAGDIEYGIRMREKGFGIYLIYSSRIYSLESSSKITGGQGLFKADSYAQPFRVYYSYRNELWVYKKYKKYRKMAKLIFHGLKNIIFCVFKGDLGGATATAKGICHGASGRIGRSKEYAC